jgi:hypothetical protein
VGNFRNLSAYVCVLLFAHTKIDGVKNKKVESKEKEKVKIKEQQKTYP